MSDTSATEQKSLVPVFTGTGFGKWRHRMANYLLQKDYEDVVGFDLSTLQPNPTAPTLATTDNAVATAANTKKDRKAKATIEHRLDDNVLTMVSNCRTSYETWKALHDNFERKTMAAVVAALKMLVETVKTPTECMQEYVARIQSNFRALKDSGMTMELLPVAMLLANVGEAFATTTAAIDTLDTVSMTKATAMLLNAEISNADSPPTAIAAQATELAALRAQIAALNAKAHAEKGNRRSFQGVPCSHHGPRSTHTSEQCYVLHPELQSKPPLSLYAVSARSGIATSVDTNWYIDSGAGRHMENDVSAMHLFQQMKGPMIQLGNDHIIESSGIGSSFVDLDSTAIEMTDVLYVKDLGKKLLSPGQATTKGIKFWFDGDRCQLFAKDGCIPPSGTIIGTSIKTVDNMYPLPSAKASPVHATFAKRASDRTSWTAWHRRLGHLNHRDMLRLLKKGARDMDVTGKIKQITLETCKDCIMGKMTRFPFLRSSTVTTRPGELVFSDLEGPFPVPSIRFQALYYVSYYDHHTKRPFIYLLRKKSDQLAALQQFNSEVFSQCGRNIHRLEVLQSDNAGEYLSNDCQAFYQQKGICHRTIVANDSESNGAPERLNRTIMEMEGCLRSHANLAPEFWEFTVGAAAYLLTRRPHSALPNRITPFEAWYGRKPAIPHYRVIGCDAWYHVPKKQRKKLQFKGRPAIFVGYANSQKAYKLWDPSTRKLVVSRTVIFDEQRFTLARNNPSHPPSILNPEIATRNRFEVLGDFTQSASDNDSDSDAEPNQAHQQPEANDRMIDRAELPERRHSVRTRAPIDRFVPGTAAPLYERAIPNEAHSQTPQHDPCIEKLNEINNTRTLHRPNLAVIQASDVPVPKTLKEAIEGQYGGHWLDSTKRELETLHRFGTLQLTELPLNRKAIGSKFVFKVKPNADGSINQFKTRLCGKGYSQRPGFDYNETYSPVAHSESIRLILALAAQGKLHLRQIDIVGAFLNGTLQEEIYMKQPGMNTEQSKDNMVYLLRKALYGLKQSGRVWNDRFDKFITQKLLFVRIKADPCVYVRISGSSFQLMGLHVDDILMAHNDLALADKTVLALASEFEITDLGMPVRLLGMRVSRPSPTGPISIDQTAYIEETLKRFGMESCKIETTPHQPNYHFSKAMCPTNDKEKDEMKNIPYNDLLGCLLWIALHTRPDLAQSVGVLCRFASNPGPLHWTGLKRILRYLAHTKTYGIRYSNSSEPLHGYCDSDHASCPDTRRSTTGYCFIQSNGPIAWKSKLQKSKGSFPGVATSSVTAEYQALYDASREAAWLRQLYQEIRFPHESPTVIYEDNQGAISMAKNHRTDSLTKHIAVKYHYTREMVDLKQTEITYCETSKMVADFLTKPTNSAKFLWCRDHIGVVDLSHPVPV